MKETPDVTLEEQAPVERKPHLHLDEIVTNEGGISFSRMCEIEEADDAGDPLDLTAEEREDYETARAQLAVTLESFRRRMVEPYDTINQRLKGIITNTFRPPKLKPPQMRSSVSEYPTPPALNVTKPEDLIQKPYRPQLLQFEAPGPLISQDELEAMAETSRERDERQGRIEDNTFGTVVAMKQMLDEMEKEAGRVEAQGNKETKRWWWVFSVAVFTLIFAAIAAFPIVAPFLEQLWRAITGS